MICVFHYVVLLVASAQCPYSVPEEESYGPESLTQEVSYLPRGSSSFSEAFRVLSGKERSSGTSDVYGGETQEAVSRGVLSEDTIRIARRIAECESNNRNIKNPNSSASGYFQFIDSTWSWVTGLAPPAMAYDYETQYQAFLKLWDEGRGATHWEPSRHCWGGA